MIVDLEVRASRAVVSLAAVVDERRPLRDDRPYAGRLLAGARRERTSRLSRSASDDVYTSCASVGRSSASSARPWLYSAIAWSVRSFAAETAFTAVSSAAVKSPAENCAHDSSARARGSSGLTSSAASNALAAPAKSLAAMSRVPSAIDRLYAAAGSAYAGDEDPLAVVLQGRIVPVRERDARVPGALAAVIDRAIADDPLHRHPTAVELRDALREAAG